MTQLSDKMQYLRTRFAGKWVVVCLLLIWMIAGVGSPVVVPAAQEIPPYQGYVNDFAGVIEPREVARLSTLLEQVQERAGVEMAVVTIPSLEGRGVEEYANALFRQWGIGQRKENSGLLLLVAPNDRKYRIEVGYGLEGDLPDSLAGDIGRRMVPYFRQKRYGDGITVAVDAIAATIAHAKGVEISGADPSLAQQRKPRRSGLAVGLVFLAIFLTFIGVVAFSAWESGRRGGRSRRRNGSDWIWYPLIFGGGGSGGFGSGSSTGSSGSSWWDAGGGGGFGDGGFGGFGGGSSGGGGASGDW
ncbi:MAG: TPM domain-containing protein [Acidobacteria bacterium]|nr:TPM domain-containing protein [Acidobacteriota bacterium]